MGREILQRDKGEKPGRVSKTRLRKAYGVAGEDEKEKEKEKE